MRIEPTVCFIIILVTLVCCKSNPTAPIHDYVKQNSDSVIMPLAIGNIWVYNNTEFDSLGNILIQDFDTTLITYADTWDGDTIYKVLIRNKPGMAGQLAFHNRSNGLWMGSAGEATTFSYFLLIPYPTTLNTHDLLYTNSLVNDDTLITTPAGTFHSLKYEALVGPQGSYGSGHDISFYSVGKGLIYSEEYRKYYPAYSNDTSEFLTKKEILQSYKLN